MSEIHINRDDVDMKKDKMAKWRMILYRGGSRDGQSLWTDVTTSTVTMETAARTHDSHVVKTELYDLICLEDESIVAVLRQ